MGDEKRDIFEFPLEEVEVPQAIVLMMQAATKCVVVDNQSVDVDNDRLQKLCDKLEARVEDAIETGLEPPVLEDAPDEEPVDESDIYLMNDGLTMNYKGLLFHRTCNMLVTSNPETDEKTFCVLVVDHEWDHIDKNGRNRP